MKKSLYVFLISIIVFTGLIILLNVNVSSRQGVNYQWRSIKIPLYLKILDFFDRHYNYKQLVREIIENATTDEERIIKIFEWTYKNIRETPRGFPVIDDHVWHIIIRGYGTNDQSSDVFTTLCNYAGLDAFYAWVYTEDHRERLPLSFVKIRGAWFIFDPYGGVSFRNREGELADIKSIELDGYWRADSLDDTQIVDYSPYLKNLPSIKDIGLKRANIQSPLNRLFFQIKKIRIQFLQWIKR